MSTYDKTFYRTYLAGSSSSAGRVVPYLVSLFEPHSVVDIGCGIGTWAAEFMGQGVPEVTGVDGEHVDKRQLQIPETHFISWDLERPLKLDQTYDLAVSVEVAEFLSRDRAESFVEDLTRLAPVVVFSAAIPFQGGTHHVNEQWGSYWHALFAEQRYSGLDCLRSRFWEDTSVDVWYRQNLMVYISEDRIHRFANFDQAMPLDVVHPELFRAKLSRPSLRFVLKSLPGAIRDSIASRLGRPQRK